MKTLTATAIVSAASACLTSLVFCWYRQRRNDHTSRGFTSASANCHSASCSYDRGRKTRL